ncbi:dockerin type I domain-containing protein, partial [Candidatus Methanarcanum hacksteinii]|uniref:dockerin type I domain-containing protein n=1 Tax=Candidatus Methanarcanum hacksteinii TaxID=2911857 RepID=UPI0037DD97FA
MDKTKMIALAAVAIIVVAAVAVVLVTNNSSSDDVQVKSDLRVFGNANGDYKIDSKDLDIIEDYLKLTESERAQKLIENPLADADYDGIITEADRDLVKKIVNGESCTVYH